jgi:hypothetical protein
MKSKAMTIGLVLAALIVSLMVGPLAGAQPTTVTQEQIDEAVAKGLEWLAGPWDCDPNGAQNDDGSWGFSAKTARTCFALVKLEERAYDLGYDCHLTQTTHTQTTSSMGGDTSSAAHTSTSRRR